jgi:hypothetical protein
MTDDKEVWKDIPGYDGRYQVSSLGRVRSNAKCSQNPDGAWVYRTVQVKKVSGRSFINLRKPHTRAITSYRINNLVAEAFIPNPTGSLEIRHIDGDLSNNKAANLEWVIFESLEGELWKAIKGFAGKYEVSTRGRVRLNKGNRYKLVTCRDNSSCVTVNIGRREDRYVVSRLVANAFLPRVKGKPLVIHIDGNLKNNKVSNLKWDTPKCEIITRKSMKTRTKNKRPTRERPVYQYTLSWNIIATHPSVQAAARSLKIHASTISACCRGKYASSGGYRWKYVTESYPGEKTGYVPLPVVSMDIDTGEACMIYKSIAQASYDIGREDSSKISATLTRNKGCVSYGLRWRYATEEEIELLGENNQVSLS